MYVIGVLRGWRVSRDGVWWTGKWWRSGRHHEEAVHGRRSPTVTLRAGGALPPVVGWALWVPASTCVRQKQRSGGSFCRAHVGAGHTRVTPRKPRVRKPLPEAELCPGTTLPLPAGGEFRAAVLPEALPGFRKRRCRRGDPSGNGNAAAEVAACGTAGCPPCPEAVHGRRSREVTLRAGGALPPVVGWALWVPASTCVRQKQRSGGELLPCTCGRGAHQLSHPESTELHRGFRNRQRARKVFEASRAGSAAGLPASASARAGCVPAPTGVRRRRRRRHLLLPAERNHSTTGAKAPQWVGVEAETEAETEAPRHR